MEDLVDILVPLLVPLGVCVVLPVMIVWLTTRGKINSDNLRAQNILEAIRNNPNVDPKELAEMFKPATKSEKEILNKRLQRGTVCSFLGLGGIIGSLLISYFGYFTSEDLMVAIFLSVIVLAVGVGALVTFFYQRKQVANNDPQDEE